MLHSRVYTQIDFLQISESHSGCSLLGCNANSSQITKENIWFPIAHNLNFQIVKPCHHHHHCTSDAHWMAWHIQVRVRSALEHLLQNFCNRVVRNDFPNLEVNTKSSGFAPWARRKSKCLCIQTTGHGFESLSDGSICKGAARCFLFFLVPNSILSCRLIKETSLIFRFAISLYRSSARQ